MRRVFFPVLLLLAAALPAVAQVQYGRVSGTVVDSGDAALPGATVTLAGPLMQGSRVAVTDAEGRYRFSLVPPGGGTR